MKKMIIISLVLAMILGISVYVTDQIADRPSVGSTEATVGGLTDLPTEEIVEIPEPTPTISAVLIQPGKDENWRENAALPETLPDKEIPFERVMEYVPTIPIDFEKYEQEGGEPELGWGSPSYQNVLISTREELDVYFDIYLNHPNLISDRHPRGLYEKLQDVDFSQKAVMLFGGRSSNCVSKVVEKIVVHENSLIVLLTSHDNGYFYQAAFCNWGTVVLIDKADLPAAGEELTIYGCTQFYPYWDYENAFCDPSVYPRTLYLPDRYVFREITE